VASESESRAEESVEEASIEAEEAPIQKTSSAWQNHDDVEWTADDEDEWQKDTHRDYYEALGLTRSDGMSISASRVRAAYHRMVQKWHPDFQSIETSGSCDQENGPQRTQHEVLRRFWLITEAYLVLKDPERRRIYDECGFAHFKQSEACYQEPVFEQDAYQVYEDFFNGTDPEARDFLLMNGGVADSGSESDDSMEGELAVEPGDSRAGRQAEADGPQLPPEMAKAVGEASSVDQFRTMLNGVLSTTLRRDSGEKECRPHTAQAKGLERQRRRSAKKARAPVKPRMQAWKCWRGARHIRQVCNKRREGGNRRPAAEKDFCPPDITARRLLIVDYPWRLTAANFILPIFVHEECGSAPTLHLNGTVGSKCSEGTEDIPISSMPDVWTQGFFVKLKRHDAVKLGVKSVVIFPKTPDELKTQTAEECFNPAGLAQRAISNVKKAFPDVVVYTDVALDPYNSLGHDGIVRSDGVILNDETIAYLCKQAVSQAEAGADYVSPSDMMDGRIGAIRDALDEAGFTNVGIMAYSAKYASAFYGPFREALDSNPVIAEDWQVPKGKETYQQDPANYKEALLEAALDEEEGADILMVKPAMPYLDIIKGLHEQSNLPIAAYHVSGEYAMLKAAALNGWLDEKAVVLEALLSIRRAGATVILTYYAKQAARWLQEEDA
ncbi:HEMB, partial [Symbiodinium sp. KB8]